MNSVCPRLFCPGIWSAVQLASLTVVSDLVVQAWQKQNQAYHSRSPGEQLGATTLNSHRRCVLQARAEGGHLAPGVTQKKSWLRTRFAVRLWTQAQRNETNMHTCTCASLTQYSCGSEPAALIQYRQTRVGGTRERPGCRITPSISPRFGAALKAAPTQEVLAIHSHRFVGARTRLCGNP